MKKNIEKQLEALQAQLEVSNRRRSLLTKGTETEKQVKFELPKLI